LQFLLAIGAAIGGLALIGWLTTLPGALHTLRFEKTTATLLSVPTPQCAKSWGSQDREHTLTFQYQFKKKTYTSHQISGGWGGLGFTDDCGQQVYHSLVPFSPVTAYVNPADASEAVLKQGVQLPSRFYFNFLNIVLLWLWRKAEQPRRVVHAPPPDPAPGADERAG